MRYCLGCPFEGPKHCRIALDSRPLHNEVWGWPWLCDACRLTASQAAVPPPPPPQQQQQVQQQVQQQQQQ